MTISWFQAILLGLFSSLSSILGMNGKAVDFLIGTQGKMLREAISVLGKIIIKAASAT